MSATGSTSEVHALLMKAWDHHVNNRYTDPTRSLYRSAIARWLRWLEKRTLCFLNATTDHVAKFCLSTSSKSTAAFRLSVLRSFCALVREQGHIDHDPTEGLRADVEPTEASGPSVPTGPAASNTPWVQQRNAVAFALRCKLGLSPHQIGVLQLSSVHIDKRMLQPPPARRNGETPEPIALPEDVVAMLQRWLKMRSNIVQVVLEGTDPGTLLVSHGGTLKRQALWKSMRRKRSSRRRTTRDVAA